jgi:preprotein translocase subunit Sec63
MYYLILFIQDDNQIAQFDPYQVSAIESYTAVRTHPCARHSRLLAGDQILELEIGADDKSIKKAYRTLSLKYHPDKNLGNKTAEECFMKVRICTEKHLPA